MASHDGLPAESNAQSMQFALARHDQHCLPEYAADSHARQLDHSHSNNQVLALLGCAHFSVCAVWQANKFGLHPDDHYRRQASWIIPYSLSAMRLGADIAAPTNGLLRPDLSIGPFREWPVSYCRFSAIQ